MLNKILSFFTDSIMNYVAIGMAVVIGLMSVYIMYLKGEVSDLTESNIQNQTRCVTLTAEKTALISKIQLLSEQTAELQSRLDTAKGSVDALSKTNEEYKDKINQATISNDSQESLDWLVNNVQDLNKNWK